MSSQSQAPSQLRQNSHRTAGVPHLFMGMFAVGITASGMRVVIPTDCTHRLFTHRGVIASCFCSLALSCFAAGNAAFNLSPPARIFFVGAGLVSCCGIPNAIAIICDSILRPSAGMPIDCRKPATGPSSNVSGTFRNGDPSALGLQDRRELLSRFAPGGEIRAIRRTTATDVVIHAVPGID